MTDVGPSDLLPETMTPEAATARIAELKATPEFTEKYLAGEVTATAEFQRLHATAFGKPNDMGTQRGLMIDTLKKYADLPEKCWEQVRNNGPVYQHERDEALRAKERFYRDRATVARYLDGSREEASLLMQINRILSSPVKEGTTK